MPLGARVSAFQDGLNMKLIQTSNTVLGGVFAKNIPDPEKELEYTTRTGGLAFLSQCYLVSQDLSVIKPITLSLDTIKSADNPEILIIKKVYKVTDRLNQHDKWTSDEKILAETLCKIEDLNELAGCFTMILDKLNDCETLLRILEFCCADTEFFGTFNEYINQSTILNPYKLRPYELEVSLQFHIWKHLLAHHLTLQKAHDSEYSYADDSDTVSQHVVARLTGLFEFGGLNTLDVDELVSKVDENGVVGYFKLVCASVWVGNPDDDGGFLRIKKNVSDAEMICIAKYLFDGVMGGFVKMEDFKKGFVGLKFQTIVWMVFYNQFFYSFYVDFRNCFSCMSGH